jgi:pimeloyl-ACP methyl ester carboxylesterase
VLRARRLPEQRIGPIRTLMMIGSEFVTLLGSAWRMMTYRRRMRDPAPAPARVPIVPIVLVHGVLCNAGVWAPMARKLASAGLEPVYALSYGPPLVTINEFVSQLDKRIDSVVAATGASQVVIVAHSMGGLVARAYLHAFGGARIARVVMIGTPHHGSVYAFFVPGACIAQMRPGNPWLAALPPVTAEPPMISLWSPHDSMVVPQTSSVLADATNVAFPGVGHNALLRNRAVFARVADEIRAAQARPPP